MALRLNNSYFRVSNGVFRSVEPVVVPPLGLIYRISNTGGSIDSGSLSYTKIDGSTASTGEVEGGAPLPKYILALSGSLTDSSGQGTSGLLAVISLIITSSIDITPTFTQEIITTTGAGTWTKPAGVTEVIVECWGGGGAGGGAIDNPAAGAGGGGGQYSRKYIQYSSPSVGISYLVGAAGTGGTGVGGDGGDTTWGTTVVIAKGGTGGGANGSIANGTTPGGVGNAGGSVGDIVYFGGNGYLGQGAGGGSAISGGGGGGAGSTSNGKSAISDIPVDVTPENGGSGGAGFINTATDGQGGSFYSSGGGGACAFTNTNRSGGAGFQGVIRITYR